MPVGIYNEAENYYTSALQGPRPFSTVAGLTDRQHAGMQGGLDAAAAYVPQAAGISNEYGQRAQDLAATGGVNLNAANTVQNIGASFDPFNNPALDSAIGAMRASSTRDFNQQQAPYLSNQATAAGQLGSSRDAISDAIQRSNQAARMDETEAGMRMQGFESGMNRYVSDRANTLQATRGFGEDSMRALDSYRTASTMPRDAVYDLANQQTAYGTAEQGINQARLNEMGQQYDFVQNQPLAQLQNYNAILNNSPGSQLSNQTTDVQNPGTNWGNVAQMGIQAAMTQPQQTQQQNNIWQPSGNSSYTQYSGNTGYGPGSVWSGNGGL